MKTVLVTGATGFIGRQTLLPLLEREYDVHAIHRASAPMDVDDVTWHRADLLKSAEVVGDVQPSHLLHLAWYAEPGKYWSSEKNLDWIRATLDLARAFQAAGGRRFVGAGTCAEYDWSAGVCGENETPIRPSSLYGASKHAASIALSAYFRQVEISAAWARIFFMYGPSEHPDRLVPSVIRALLVNRPAQCSSGEQRRDFSHVADIASALVALLDSDVEGPVNVGSGTARPVHEIVSKIGQILERTEWIEFGALPKKKDDPPLIVADTTRLLKVVGWRPRFDLESGLRDAIEWWKREAVESERA